MFLKLFSSVRQGARNIERIINKQIIQYCLKKERDVPPHTHTTNAKSGLFPATMSLKIRARSPKPTHVSSCPNVISMQIWFQSAH